MFQNLGKVLASCKINSERPKRKIKEHNNHYPNNKTCVTLSELNNSIRTHL